MQVWNEAHITCIQSIGNPLRFHPFSLFFYRSSFINLYITFLIFVYREKQTSRNIAFRRWILHRKTIKKVHINKCTVWPSFRVIISFKTATNYFARELDKAFRTILGEKERVIQSMVKCFQVCVWKQRRHVG